MVSFVIEDFYKIFFWCKVFDKEFVMVGRVVVLGVVIIGILFFLKFSDMILGLVGYVWVGFGLVFGFVILLSFYWKCMIWWGVFVGMIVGVVIVLIWVNILLKDVFYEMIFGFFLSLLVVIIVSLLIKKLLNDV